MKKLPRLVMLSGTEEVLRRRALKELLSAANVETDELDYSVVDATTPIAEWLAMASTFPFLSERRTVVVRNLLRAEPGRLEEFKNLPESALLILVADDETGDDNRQQRLETIRNSWEKLIKEAGGTVEKFTSNSKSIVADIRNEASRLDKQISERAAALLSEMVGGSLSRAFEELEKLAIYIGDQATIQEQDIRGLVMASPEWNVFKLIDSVVGNDPSAALKQLQILVVRSAKAEEMAFRSILPLLSRQFRLIWQGRICLDRGFSRGDGISVPPECQNLFPSKPNLPKEPPYRQSSVLSLAGKTSYGQLAQCFRTLSDTDARMKGILPGVNGMDTLERMVLELRAVFASA